MKKNNLKKANFAVFAFFVMLAILFSGAKHVFAQETPPEGDVEVTVVANVNITDAKFEKQEKNNLTISFNISNDFDKFQPGILLSASLVKNENDLPAVADKKVIGSEFTLGPNEKIHRQITYAVPEYIQGEYGIRLEANIADGLPLSIAEVGKTTFAGTNNYVEVVNSTCFLKVKGESADKKYTPDQGVDIEKNENLEAVCDLMNHSSQAKKFTVQFQTFWRSILGETVGKSQGANDSFFLDPKEKRQIVFDLPIANDSQAYDVKLTLAENGKTISNSAVFHYVLRGASATIQSLQLDKNSYQKGETAKVTMIISGSADNFPDTRHGEGTKLEDVSLSVKIQSGATLCGEAQKNPQMRGIPEDIGIPMSQNCPSPIASLILKDKTGKILAQKDFFVGKNSQVEREKASQLQTGETDGKKASLAIIIIIVVLIISIVVYSVWKYKKRSSIIFPMTILGAGLIALSSTAQPASALTLCAEGHGIYCADVSIDKSVYHTNEPVRAFGNNIYGVCNNGYNGSYPLQVRINNVTYDINEKWPVGRYGSSHDSFFGAVSSCGAGYHWAYDFYGVCYKQSGSATGIAQSVPGDYYATFLINAQQNGASTSADVPYKVIAGSNGECGSANNTASCSAPSPSSNLCLVGTPSQPVDQNSQWRWACSGAGRDVVCSAAKPVINAVCGTEKYTCDPGSIENATETSTSWDWICNNHCNGATPKCSVAKEPIFGECKTPPNNKEYCLTDSEKPDTLSADQLCSKYDPSRSPSASFNPADNSWDWTCYGQNTGSEGDRECKAYLKVKTEGQCGSANGTTICDDTSIQWCTSGNKTGDPEDKYKYSYDVSWQCTGTCGGQTADCSARGTKACGWIETSP